jgi:gliding motility-associated-like protein
LKDKDPIVDLFESKLGNAEFDIDPSIWTNITSQIPATGTISTGLSVAAKLAIAAGISSVVVITSVLIFNSNDQEKIVQDNPIVEINEVESIEQKRERVNQITVEEYSDESLEKNPAVPVLKENQKESGMEPAVLDILEADAIINKDFIITEDQLIQEYVESNDNSSETQINEVKISEDVIEEPLIEETVVEKKTQVTIPNVFTPNNDGQNDLYNISYSGEIEDVSVVIFNRNGEIVFKSTDPNFNWNGRNMMDEPCVSGAYLFMLTARDLQGNNILESRDFQLLR